MFDATIKINVSGGDIVTVCFLMTVLAIFAAAVVYGACKPWSGVGDDLDGDDDPTDDDQPSGGASATPAGP